MNLYYLLTLPLTAAAAFLASRALGAWRPASVAAAILFATAPYHFLRGETHLFYSGYFALPAGAYLVIAVLSRRPLFRGWRSRTTVTTVGCCAVLALGNLYYAAFALVLLGLATVLAVARWEPAAVVQGVLVTSLLAGLMALALVPTAIMRMSRSANGALARGPWDGEAYSLTLTRMLMPIEGHNSLIAPVAAVPVLTWQAST